MSTVTNVMLSCSIDEDLRARIQHINMRLQNHEGASGWWFELAGVKEDDWPCVSGGSKAMERPVFLAAFNCLDVPHLLYAVKTAGWEFPDRVQVFLCGQEDERWWCCYGPGKDCKYNHVNGGSHPA